jgi:hypothetical protein
MEPRPQRPRAQSGQHTQAMPPAESTAQQQGAYGQGPEPPAFIAPPRTEYDYSPLDLAPPGQRRRRQLVAAVVGALSVLLLGAVVFFSYLLLRDEEPPSEQDDVLAAQTEVAQRQATLDAEETIIAQAAAEQTQQAENLNPQETGEAETPVATEGATEEAPATNGETPADATEEPATGDDGGETSGTGTSEFAGQPNLTGDQLETLLPSQDVVPETLTVSGDLTRTEEEVAGALGGNRLAETNLETWGWSGNVERQFSSADPASVDPTATSFITVSIHGFGSAESCAEALVFFSDIVVESGAEEVEAPELGDSARMLTSTADDGTTIVALYVQDGAVLYRFGGASLEGDPSQDVIDVATATLGG